MSLQVIEAPGKTFSRFHTDTLTDEICQFVSVLTRRWNFHRSRPIVIQVAELVGQTLYVIGLHVCCVVKDDIVSWGYSSLPRRLRNEEEVVPISTCDDAINHRARWWILQASTLKINTSQCYQL